MDLRLSGKRALVTGSSSGLGETIVKLLAAEGASVVVHGRDEARTAAVATSIREDGGDAAVAIGDLGTDAGADAVEAAVTGGGPVDILVNNVGVYDMTMSWTGSSPEDWAEIYNVNVISSVRMIQRLVPGMRERGWGRVIQISSVTGELPAASQPHYAATNAARNTLATSLSRELRHSGVTSNSVAAGGVLTPAIQEFLVNMGRRNGWGETWREIEPNLVNGLSPNDVGRVGRPREYADLVAFLASPVAGYITGATLRIDGGWHDA
ncbi:SDR family NAD(P)-dependent oxidoreductase [Streptosporangium lutulentum]|uniref:NAD(P)-dependent dehydrogenase (Short-subunit alcohol dehydrogenase family) n=1 Tax=Streptosporangium lutulentum TaxID=1461250 RepID=A0ABT9QB14_9ACTN|nr:SDR family NAD(P)-dependent oxidoreductase [Streptosporangium lutulentum]MDP9843957.1 NAD(P)-dependent dehydrogenase (short-subunit alcohol dehydrogenase family) [Streptosporangium lutulentum]